MLDFRIYTFLAVCEHMNYTKAAEALHITQPAVTQHIHYLEDYYHTSLFVREGKQIHITPAGEVLFHAASAIRNDEALIQDQIIQVQSAPLSLQFGVTMTIGEFVITAPLARYMKEHPEEKINLIFSNTSDLLSRLQSGELNFALVEGYFSDEAYESITFSTEDFIAAAAAGHEFAEKPHYLSDLLSEHLLIREPGSGTRSILEKNLDTHNISVSDFRKVTIIGNVHAILDLVKADCGITFLYKAAAEKELDRGELTEIQLEDFHMKHNFSFIWNKGSIYSGKYTALCKELQNYRK